MPSRVELVSLFAAADDTNPSTNGFPISGPLLSSSQFLGTPQIPVADPQVWIVDVSTRYLDHYDASGKGTAVCVRSKAGAHANPTPPTRVLTADVVNDTGTGLFWERTPHSIWDTHAASKAYCAALSLGGYDDWRMPSIEEMLTISEPERLWPSINTSDFPGDEGIESGWFWSATPYPMPQTYHYAPGLNFGGVYSMGQYEDAPLLVRCVR